MAINVMYLSESQSGSTSVGTVIAQNAYITTKTLESMSDRVPVPYAPSPEAVGVVLCSPSQTNCRRLTPETDYEISGNMLYFKPQAFASGFLDGMFVFVYYPDVPVLDLNTGDNYTETVVLKTDGEVYTNVTVQAELALESANQYAVVQLLDSDGNPVDELNFPKLDSEGVIFSCKVTVKPEFYELFDSGFYPLVQYVVEYTD